MKKVSRIGKGLLPVLVLGLAAGALLSFGCGDEKTVTEYVEVVNNAPVLGEIGAKAVNLGGPLTIVVTATDPEGDTLSYMVLNLPPGATFVVATRTFSWTPEPGVIEAGDYEVIFIVYDGNGNGDSETVTITVSAVGATGANYTGKYTAIASNFPTGEGTCADYLNEFEEDLCTFDIPAPGCEEDIPPLFAVQSDDGLIFYMNWYGTDWGFKGGTIKNDGSFEATDSVTTDLNGPITLILAITGKISADKIEGRMEIDLRDGDSCDWSFDFAGGGLDNHNATITVNGFTDGKGGVNVYAFAYRQGGGNKPKAIGGGRVPEAGGSVEINLIPALPEGRCYNVAVWLDIDGDIEDCWDDNGEFCCFGSQCEGDLCKWLGEIEGFCIEGGVPGVPGNLVLDAADFELCVD
ncbi:MAG: hypothetical protein JSU92_00800 [Deltaproteobacteria bacterium]|nr:MAG: hypothetical protein JSU92_00800 [Deltaproteobacteria bacterium]